MATTEDCASVLEQFVHDAANLPAEISHMMEEIQAKDNELQKSQTSINTKDVNIQKHIKVNGVLQAHPKEGEYADSVKKHFELASNLQSQKVLLSEKACALLDRQIKKLDIKIRELQNDNQLSLDGPPLPSIFNRKAEQPKIFPDAPASLPLQQASVSALNANAHRMNSQVAASLQQAQARPLPQVAALNTAPQRSSAPATPAAALQQRQREREVSLGAESRKRKLGALVGANIPTQPSSLRQSSLGPGTPKAGTPTGTSGSRAGSVPRATSAHPASAVTATKKTAAPLSKKLMSSQLNKLKTKQAQRLSLNGRKKGQSPSVRSGRGGTAASEGDESVLSSADASETDASQTRSRGGRKKKVKQEQDVEMMEDAHDEEEADDDTVYCICQQPSYGEMVACENDDCKHQWFHTGCVGMKKIPEEDEDWYCPDCRVLPEIIEKVRIKALGLKKSGRK